MKDWALLLSRVALAACVLPVGTTHLLNVSGLALAFWMKGMPFSNGVATACALGEVFGAAGLALGLAPRLTAAVLSGSILVLTGTAHRFWDISGPARALEQATFVGNVAVVAALGFYFVAGPGAWSWKAFWAQRNAAQPEPPKRKQSRARKPLPKPAAEELADAA